MITLGPTVTVGWSPTSGKRMPGTSRCISRLSWSAICLDKENGEKTSCPRLSLKVPDILLPDVGDQTNSPHLSRYQPTSARASLERLLTLEDPFCCWRCRGERLFQLLPLVLKRAQLACCCCCCCCCCNAWADVAARLNAQLHTIAGTPVALHVSQLISWIL